MINQMKKSDLKSNEEILDKHWKTFNPKIRLEVYDAMQQAVEQEVK